MFPRPCALVAAALLLALAPGCGSRPAVIERREELKLETLPSMQLRLVLPVQEEGYAPRYVTTATRAFRRFGEWLAPFPQPQVTIVGGSAIQPGESQPASAILVRTPWLAPARAGSLELMLMHAIARAFMSGPAPSQPSVLVDALALYLTIKGLDELAQDEKYPGGHAFERRYFGGHLPYVFYGVSVEGQGWLARVDAPEPVERAVRAMLTLERVVGWGTFQQAITVFFERRRAGSGDIETFQQSLEQVSGRDLRWFMDEAFRSARTYDYGVESLRSESDSTNRDRFNTTVVVRRYGDAVFSGTSRVSRAPFRSSGPLEVAVTFADGSIMRERWDGRAESMQLEYESTSPAVAAAIDLDQVLQMDENRANNRRTVLPPRRVATIWALRWAIWLQDAMLSHAWLF